MVQPATASPTPRANRISVTLGMRDTMRRGGEASATVTPEASVTGWLEPGGTTGATFHQRGDLGHAFAQLARRRAGGVGLTRPDRVLQARAGAADPPHESPGAAV